MKERAFLCTHCNKRFVHEVRFLRHSCKEMQRNAEIKTPDGQAAWSYYQKWMKALNRGSPGADAFVKSKYYNAFIKFNTFVKKVNIPSVDKYIRLMSKDGIGPQMWTMDEAYRKYIEYTDRLMPAGENAKITIDTLYDVAHDYNCTVEDLFDNIGPSVVINLLRQRKLSPWVLLKSTKFKAFFGNVCSNEERMIMESIIRPTYWADKFAKNPREVNQMKIYVKALSI